MSRPWRLLLRPLAPIYAAGSALRWRGVKPQRLAWPVVSVGNLSTGGTGKTPLTIALAKLLASHGVSLDVLSRGYGRRSSQAARVDPAGTAEEFGDEPLLIAETANVPVFVARSRYQAGLLAERNGQRRGMHLLDDGFQHRQLARDIDIVLVNSEDLADCPLPAGNLREPLSALRRATVFAVPATDDAAVERLARLGLTQPVWRFSREMAVPPVGGPVAAFCGIARPQQFFAGIERSGLSIVARRAFPDHFRFRPADIQALERLADRSGAQALLTTEKDRVRIGGLTEHLGQCRLLTVGLTVSFEDSVAKSVLALLHSR